MNSFRWGVFCVAEVLVSAEAKKQNQMICVPSFFVAINTFHKDVLRETEKGGLESRN